MFLSSHDMVRIIDLLHACNPWVYPNDVHDPEVNGHSMRAVIAVAFSADKEGSKIAAITADNDHSVWVFNWRRPQKGNVVCTVVNVRIQMWKTVCSHCWLRGGTGKVSYGLGIPIAKTPFSFSRVSMFGYEPEPVV